MATNAHNKKCSFVHVKLHDKSGDQKKSNEVKWEISNVRGFNDCQQTKKRFLHQKHTHQYNLLHGNRSKIGGHIVFLFPRRWIVLAVHPCTSQS